MVGNIKGCPFISLTWDAQNNLTWGGALLYVCVFMCLFSVLDYDRIQAHGSEHLPKHFQESLSWLPSQYFYELWVMTSFAVPLQALCDFFLYSL